MSVHVTMRTEDGIPVLALEGLVEAPLLQRLARGIEAVASELTGPMVIDVDQLAFGDLDDVSTFMSQLRRGRFGDRLLFLSSQSLLAEARAAARRDEPSSQLDTLDEPSQYRVGAFHQPR